jgi:glucose-1-phosphate thymidylyltransferase
MKAVIPAAGIGKRLRPHTLNKPKALLPVAGRPILGHIVDELHGAGLREFVIVVGFHGKAVREWFAAARPHYDVTFVEQTERKGLGHAVHLTRPVVGGEPFFCLLGDTILKAEYRQLLDSPRSVVAVREVEDPRRFGVVETDGGRATRFVEKPDQPTTNLALVGAYLFREPQALWEAMDEIIRRDLRTKGEYQLTDALQLMVDGGVEFGTVPIEDWFDCGKAETWLQTNRELLDQAAAGRERPGVHPPCAVAEDVALTSTRVGPYVSIGAGAVLEDCELSDCIIGAYARLRGCRLQQSLIGEHCRLTAVSGQVNVGDYCELLGPRA